MLDINSIEMKIHNFCQTTQDVDSMESCLNTKQTHHVWFMRGVQNRDITFIILMYFLSNISSISLILKEKNQCFKGMGKGVSFCLLVSANRSFVIIWNVNSILTAS